MAKTPIYRQISKGCFPLIFSYSGIWSERLQWVDSAHSSIAAAKVSLWAEKLPLDSSFSDSARQIRLQSSHLVYLNRAAEFLPFARLPIAALT